LCGFGGCEVGGDGGGGCGGGCDGVGGIGGSEMLGQGTWMEKVGGLGER
jgi:hypothetical protein